MSVWLGIQRGLALALAGAGLVWGFCTLPNSEAADDFRYFESQLLQSETYSSKTLALQLASPAAQAVSDCDTHSQTALMLMEMRLAQAALRSGGVAEFDKHAQSLESRSRRTLACAPRQSFIWLLAFSLSVVHGRLNEHTFDLLAISFETSPNEAWISIRRTPVALPLVLIASEPLRKQILHEFQQLISNGFVDVAAHSYLAVSGSIRSLLQAQIEQLEPAQQKTFAEALHKFGS
jgi:hypothetical protein